MTTIGYTTLQIIPTLDGITAAVEKQTSVLPGLGKAAGKALGDGLAAGVDVAAKKVEAATGKIAAANKKVEDSSGKVRVAEAQLQSLREKGVTDAGRLAAAEEKVAAAQRNHEQASNAAKSATDALKSAEDKLAEASKRAADGQKAAGNAAGDSASKSGLMTRAAGVTGKAFDTLADKAKSAGKTILAGVGFGAGMNIGGITKSLIDMGDTFANVNKTIAFSTGASGKELEALNSSVRTIGKDSPKALTDIAESMAGVARATQLTGKPLEDITKRMIKLDGLGQGADITGLTQAMRAFGVPAEKMAAQMDDLFKVSRSTGIGMDQLAQTAFKGAPQFKQFGFGIGETAALLGNLQKAGVNGEQVTVGLNKAMINLSKGGGDVKKKLSDAIAGIQGMIKAGNEAGAMESAGKLFGTKSAGQFVAAIKSGKFNLDEMNKSIGGQQKGILDAGGAVTSMAGAWQMFKNNVMVLLEPIVTRIFASMQKGILWFRGEGVNAIRGFGETLKGIWDSGPVQAFGAALGAAGGFMAEHSTTMKVLAGVLVAALVPALATATVAWTTAKVQAVASAAAQLAASYRTVTGWVAAGASATANAAVIAGGWIAASAGAVGATAKTVAYGIAQGAIKAATAAWTGAQWLLNAALNANPIGLIVIGLAALVAGIVLAYKNSETFRNIVAGAWSWIKDAAAATVSWFTDSALPFLGKVWDGIKAGWDMLVTAAGVAWDLITLPARTAIAFFTDTLPAALSTVWELVKSGWNTLVESAQAVWTGVTDKFNGIVTFVTGIPEKIRTAASGMWDGIKEAFKGAINWIIRAWNSLEFKIPGFKVGPVGYDGFTLGVPDLPEFFSGGHTGPGSKYQVAGVVHADEFVLSKRARGMLESAAPGGLDFMNKTGQWPGYAEGGRVQTAEGLNPGADYLRTLIMKKWPEIKTIGGRRAEDGYGEHSSGNALDVMIPNYGSEAGKALGAQILAYLQQNAAALQLDGVIWHQASFGYGGSLTDGKTMSDRGSDTQNHLDHLHVILGKGRGEGAAPTEVPAGLDGAPAATAAETAATAVEKPSDGKPEDAKAAEKPQTSAPAQSTGGGSYPTSISGWAGFIGENFVGGQIKSLLSVFGIPDSPSWMKGASQLIGGIKVADKDGKSLFDGSNPLAGITGAVDGKQQTPAKADPAAMPGGSLPLTGQQGTPPVKPAAETLTSTLSAPPAEYKGGSQPIYDAVYKEFRAAGFTDAMWPDFVNIENNEAGWDPEARNPKSDAYGFAQFLGKGNVDKYLGGQNSNVPIDVQAKGMMQYLKDRYTDPSKAWEFWQKNNWYAEGGRVEPFLYDSGGLLPQGMSLVENRSGGPEPILTQDYWSTAKSAIDVATSMFQGQAGGQQKQLPQVNYTINARDTEDAFIRAQRQEKERAAAKLSRF